MFGNWLLHLFIKEALVFRLTEQIILLTVLEKWPSGGSKTTSKIGSSCYLAVGSLYWQTQSSWVTPLPSNGEVLLKSSPGRRFLPWHTHMHARTHTHAHVHTHKHFHLLCLIKCWSNKNNMSFLSPILPRLPPSHPFFIPLFLLPSFSFLLTSLLFSFLLPPSPFSSLPSPPRC